MTRRGGRRLSFTLLLLAVLGGLISGGIWWREHGRRTRIAGLQVTRDALLRRLAELRAKDAVIAALPRGNVAVGVSQAAGGELAGRFATEILGQVTLELRDLRARKEGRVGGKVLFARVSPGTYSLDVQIHELRAVLGAHKPELRFLGRRVEVVQPVRIVRGEGRATLNFRWDTRGISNAFCGDLSARIPVAGTVVPRSFAAKGNVELRLEGGAVAVMPSFPDVEVNLQVEPSSDTWAAVDRFLQGQGLRCRTALKVADVPARLREVMGRGFKVKVPGSVVRPFVVSAGLRRDVTLRGEAVALDVAARELTTAPGFIWYGADVKAAAITHATMPARR
jgi:hypothetical protein